MNAQLFKLCIQESKGTHKVRTIADGHESVVKVVYFLGDHTHYSPRFGTGGAYVKEEFELGI